MKALLVTISGFVGAVAGMMLGIGCLTMLPAAAMHLGMPIMPAVSWTISGGLVLGGAVGLPLLVLWFLRSSEAEDQTRTDE